MLAVFAFSLAVAWLVSGAAVSDPLAPLRHTAEEPTVIDVPANPLRGARVAWVEVEGIELPLPERFTEADSSPDAPAALAQAPHRVWSDPQRPARRLTALVVTAPEPTAPRLVAERWLQALWSDQLQDPARIAQTPPNAALRAFEIVLVPVRQRGERVGDLDLLAAATPDGRRFLVLHLRDRTPDAASIDPLIGQGTTLLRTIYENARFKDEP
jgi:hypothetical protein